MNIEILKRSIIRIIVRLLHIFPISDRTILFESYFGKSVSDSPLYVFEYLNNYYNNDDLKLIWTSAENVKTSNECILVKPKSIKWFYYQSVSKVIVSNMRPYSFIPQRKGQEYIETWHAGGAYKRVGSDVLNNSNTRNDVVTWSENNANKRITLFLSSSDLFTKYNIIESFKYSGEVLKSGLPRNDCLLNDLIRDSKSVATRNNLKCEEFVVLYAPTWRGESEKKSKKIDYNLDVEKIINKFSEKFNKKVTMLTRIHYNDCNDYSFAGCVDVTSYPDMQDLLCVSDVLITDYSSCMWDFALLKRPCFLFVPDAEEYIDNDRGTYTPIDKWPGIVCHDINDLMTSIDELDIEKYKQIPLNHLREWNSYEEGEACKKVCDFIMNCVQGVNKNVK